MWWNVDTSDSKFVFEKTCGSSPVTEKSGVEYRLARRLMTLEEIGSSPASKKKTGYNLKGRVLALEPKVQVRVCYPKKGQ